MQRPGLRRAMRRSTRSDWISGCDDAANWAATRFDGRSAAGDVVLLRIDGDDAGRHVAQRARSRSHCAMSPSPRRSSARRACSACPADTRSKFPMPSVRFRPRSPPRARRRRGSCACSARGRPSSSRWPCCVAGGGMDLLRRAADRRTPCRERAASRLRPAHRRERARAARQQPAAADARWPRSGARPSTSVSARQPRSSRRASTSVSSFAPAQVNAFALPGGIIVVFDELVELAGDDDRVLGVLGHELGHVVHRHSTRQLLQALGLAAIAGVVWGDFSSHRLERSAGARADALRPRVRGRGGRLRARVPARERPVAAPAATNSSCACRSRTGSAEPDQVPDFLSTHPDVNVRARAHAARSRGLRARRGNAAVSCARLLRPARRRGRTRQTHGRSA